MSMGQHSTTTIRVGNYAKAIVAIATAATAALGTALTDSKITDVELVSVGVALVTAVGVYLVPNLSSGIGRYAKGVVAFLGAAGTALVNAIGAGGFADVGLNGWLVVAFAALGAIGVTVVPNTSADGESGTV